MEPLSANDPRTVGEFQLRARLGAGGMGQVYLGFSPAGRAVAVKVVHSALVSDREFRERFGREVAAARMVSGMYTAPVVAAGLDDDPPWFATAFVPGPSLADVVGTHGTLPEAAVWRLAAGLTEALRAVHSCGLVHRDLKPANVLLASDGPHVIDFGISRAFEGTALTATGMVVGTPGYMSPEQAEGAVAGPQSDVFSLGCVLAFAATGTPPFGGGSAASVLYRVVTGEPDLATVPPALRPVIEACLRKDPGERVRLPALTSMISSSGPATVATLGAFWPPPLDGIIAASQSGFTAQVPAGAAAPAGAASGSGPGGGGHTNHLPTATALGTPPPGGPAGMVPDGYLQAATRSMAAGSQLAPSYPGQPVTPQSYQPQPGTPSWPQVGGAWQYAGAGQGPATSWPASSPGTPWPQSAAPSYPQYGAADPLARYTPGQRRPAKAEVPGPVLAAVRLMWTGLAFSTLELIFAAVALGRYSNAEKLHPRNAVFVEHLQGWGNVVGTFGVFASILALVLWTLLAVASRRGRGWARVAGTVLFGLSTVGTLIMLFGSWGDYGAKFFAVIVWIIGLATTILLWGGQATAFFDAWQQHPRRHMTPRLAGHRETCWAGGGRVPWKEPHVARGEIGWSWHGPHIHPLRSP